MAMRSETRQALPVRLGGVAATAEAAWMATPQAAEFLELPRQARRWTLARARLPRVAIPAVVNREFGIAGATAILMASFFASALLGAVRQIVFNAMFGAGAEASAYYAAFRLPDTLFSLLAGGALSSAFIPVLVGVRQRDGDEAARRLAGLVLTTLLAIVLLVALVGELAAPLFVRYLLVPGYDGATQDLTVRLTRIMLLQPIILVMGSVATAVLNSRNQFLLTALSVASHNLALIAGIMAAASVPGLGIYGPTLGVVGGAILQTLILAVGIAGSGVTYRPVWDLRDPRLREVGRLLLPNGLAVGVGYAGFIADTAFASRASEPAALASIHNAWLLVGLPIALLGQAVGQAAFPRMSAHAAAGATAALRSTIVRAIGAMCGLSLVAGGGILIVGRSTIRVLFERGEFTAADGDVTATVLVIYALGLPAYVATEVLVRAQIAMRSPQTQLFTNTGQLLLRVVLVAALLGPFQVRAIPLAFVISAALETVVLIALTFGKLRAMERHGADTRAAP